MRIRRWKNLFGRIKVLKVLVFSVSREITDLPPYTALICCEGENNMHMGHIYYVLPLEIKKAIQYYGPNEQVRRRKEATEVIAV